LLLSLDGLLHRLGVARRVVRVVGRAQGRLLEKVWRRLVHRWRRRQRRGGRPPQAKSALVTRVNSTNVLDEGLRIGGIGRRMNSKVKLVKQGMYRK
jgi:hypothetical protein